MNTIETNDLRPGQIFSEPVYTDETNLLVPAFVPLRKKDLALLARMGLDVVKTNGLLMEETVPESELEEDEEEYQFEDIDIVRQEDVAAVNNRKESIKFSISDVRINSGPYRDYKHLIEKLNITFSALKAGEFIEMRTIDGIGAQLLKSLRDYRDSFVGFILGGEVSGHELAKSSINTAILSALTAHELKLPAHKVNNIVSGALLHDVGMLRLSKQITEKKGGLSEAETEQIKSHSMHSSRIVSKELLGPQEVSLIAMQHHERWDGQGYPDKLSGQAIEIGARIVSVADAFEAMVSKKSYRPSLGGYQAIKNLLSDNGRRFDPTVIMAFTKIMGIYPIGSIVRLNDASVARVVNINTDAPMRPVVQILVDASGNVRKSAADNPAIDLLADKTLFIKQAIDPAEFENSHD